MLVLTRKAGQRIVAGDITVSVLTTGPQVKIGIEAPADVTVLRGELEGEDVPGRDLESRFDEWARTKLGRHVGATEANRSALLTAFKAGARWSPESVVDAAPYESFPMLAE